MCVMAMAAPIVGAFTGGGAAAAGTGLTFGKALMTVGAIASAGGQLYQGVQSSRIAKANAEYAEQQSAMERQLGAVEDQRVRDRMRRQMAAQRAELVARGVSLDSPTAILLGREAAKELTFESQRTRLASANKQAQLSAEARSYRMKASSALWSGGLSAAGSVLSAAPKLWPGLSGGTGSRDGVIG